MKLILDIKDDMNNKLEQLAEIRGGNKATITRWAISKLIEQELQNEQRQTTNTSASMDFNL